jgi:Tfp pilus assembly protein PilF
MFEEVLGFDKEKPEIFLSLAMALVRKKNYTRAEEVLADALARFRDNEELYFNLAMIYDKTERFDAMIEALRKTLEVNPKNAEALNYLGYYYADKNINLQESRGLIERALALKPDDGYILDSYGWVLYRLGQYDQALEKLERAVSLSSEDPMLFEHLGDVYQALKKSEKALENWKRALKNHEKEEGLKERVEKKIQETEVPKR